MPTIIWNEPGDTWDSGDRWDPFVPLVPSEPPLPPGLNYGGAKQEPPYCGPFDPRVYDPNVFATLCREDEEQIRWCKVCMKLVVVDTREIFRHPHFIYDEEGAVVG